MGFTDAGHLITIGASPETVMAQIGFIAITAIVFLSSTDWPRLRVAAGFALLAAFVLAYYLGDKIIFGPAYVRETVWFREVGRVDWRHVESAALEPRALRTPDGKTQDSPHLVLKLRTMDEWLLNVAGMEPSHQARLLAFSKERIAPR